VICSIRIGVPIHVDAIGGGGYRRRELLLWSSEGCTESLVAMQDRVALFVAQLARRAVGARVVVLLMMTSTVMTATTESVIAVTISSMTTMDDGRIFR